MRAHPVIPRAPLRHSRARHGNPHDPRRTDGRAPVSPSFSCLTRESTRPSTHRRARPSLRHSRARRGNPTTVDTPTGAPIPSFPCAPCSVILVLDTGTHTTVDTPACAPPLRHSRARHGNPHDRRHTDVRAPAPSFSCSTREPTRPSTHRRARPAPPRYDIRPSPRCPYPPTIPVVALSNAPRNPASWRRGAPARFTSKCRKMSQNVALFHTPTRRMAYFTSKKPHVFDQNRAFWARFCSFSALAPGNGLSLRPLGACSILPAPRSRNRGRPQGRTTLVERRAHGS